MAHVIPDQHANDVFDPRPWSSVYHRGERLGKGSL